MLERDVESDLKWLEGKGFKVLKLVTPGTSGTKDRLILAPLWSPAPPVFVEVKRPGERERALQVGVRDDWRKRGCDVRDCVSTPGEVSNLCLRLLYEAEQRAPDVRLPWQRTAILVDPNAS